jgi:hypothetical protein
MLKQILSVVLAVQLIAAPVKAADEQKHQCTQGDMVTTFLTIYFVVSIVTGIIGAMQKIKHEQEQKKTEGCKI